MSEHSMRYVQVMVTAIQFFLSTVGKDDEDSDSVSCLALSVEGKKVHFAEDL